MYQSRLRMWSIFSAWSAAAVFCGLLDNSRKSTLFLPTFLICSAIVAVISTRKHRPRNYEFALVGPGVLRSSLGFEVRASSSRLEYVEGNHMISWPACPAGSVGRFMLSESEISGWDSPFDTELMNGDKKREIAKAVISALLYLQSVDAGKIRPNRH